MHEYVPVISDVHRGLQELGQFHGGSYSSFPRPLTGWNLYLIGKLEVVLHLPVTGRMKTLTLLLCLTLVGVHSSIDDSTEELSRYSLLSGYFAYRFSGR